MLLAATKNHDKIFNVANSPLITLFLHYSIYELFNHVSEHKTTNYEGTDDCGSTAVTDNLFMHSAFTTCNKNTFKLLSLITKRNEIYTKAAKL